MVKILELIGFEIVRIKGSHYFLKSEENKLVTTVPIHDNENLSVGIIKDVLSDVDISKEEYEKLRKKKKSK